MSIGTHLGGVVLGMGAPNRTKVVASCSVQLWQSRRNATSRRLRRWKNFHLLKRQRPERKPPGL